MSNFFLMPVRVPLIYICLFVPFHGNAQDKSNESDRSVAAKAIFDSIKIKQTETQKAVDENEEATRELREAIQLSAEIERGLLSLDQSDSERRRNEIQSLKRRIAALEAIDAISNKTPQEIQKRISDETSKRKELSKKLGVASEPYHDAMRNLVDKYAEESKALSAAILPYFKMQPDKPFAEFSRVRGYGVFAQAVVNCTYEIKGEPVCQLSIYFDQKGYDGEKVGSINMLHDVLQLSDHHAVVRTNGMTIHMHALASYPWTRERITEAIAEMIDLDSLAEIELPQGNLKSNE